MNAPKSTVLEATLKQDRAILVTGLLAVIAMSWIWLLLGAGMDMSPAAASPGRFSVSGALSHALRKTNAKSTRQYDTEVEIKSALRKLLFLGKPSFSDRACASPAFTVPSHEHNYLQFVAITLNVRKSHPSTSVTGNRRVPGPACAIAHEYRPFDRLGNPLQ